MIVKSCKSGLQHWRVPKRFVPASLGPCPTRLYGVSMSSVSTSISVRALDQELSPATKEVGTDEKE
jgi:hypothetical protein